jgi:hypothetical protein
MAEKENEVPQVGEMDPSKKNSPIVDKAEGEETRVNCDKLCMFNDRKYTHGACVCSGGVLLQCNGYYGYWNRTGKC